MMSLATKEGRRRRRRKIMMMRMMAEVSKAELKLTVSIW